MVPLMLPVTCCATDGATVIASTMAATMPSARHVNRLINFILTSLLKLHEGSEMMTLAPFFGFMGAECPDGLLGPRKVTKFKLREMRVITPCVKCQ
jgi:hypothetical protein